MPLDELWPDMQVLVIGKISNAVVLAGAAYQDEAGYSRMTGLPREKTRLLDDKGKTDTQVCPPRPMLPLCRTPIAQYGNGLLEDA